MNLSRKFNIILYMRRLACCCEQECNPQIKHEQCWTPNNSEQHYLAISIHY